MATGLFLTKKEKDKSKNFETFFNKQLILKETLHIIKTLLQHSNTLL